MPATLTKPEVLVRLASLPPAARSQALLYARRLYQPAPPVHQRSPEDQALYDACEYDVRRFAAAFFPEHCTVPFSPMHHDWFATWKADAETRGLRDVTAAPRGYAKTTLRSLIKLVHDCVYGHERFIVVVSSRHDMARDKVKDVRDVLETNERLLEVFGRQQTGKWNETLFVTQGGVRVQAASPRSQIRGLKWGAIRPTKLVLDDAENAEHVQTETQRDKFWRTVTSDFFKLGTPTTNIDVVGTILHEQSLIARLLEAPGWRGRKYQAVRRWADQAPELWQAWREIFCDGSRARDAAKQAARDFFTAHQDSMLAGHDVLWEAREPYVELMEQILTEGETAFATEKQNAPELIQERLFNLDAARFFTVAPDRLVFPSHVVPLYELVDLAAFWDPALGQGGSTPGDYSACVVVGKDRRGYFYVLDAYLSNVDKPAQQLVAITDLLWRWQVPKIGIESNGFQSLLVGDLREAVATRALAEQTPWSVQFLQVHNSRAKELRISTLEPYLTNGWLALSARLPAEALRQLRVYRPLPDADHDDFLDSCEGALRVLRGLLAARDAG